MTTLPASFGNKGFLSQPKPFYLIFMLEIWERFGYYGVQAILILYLVQALGFTDKSAAYLLTTYAAFVYLLPAVGGYVGDKVLGTKRTILLGAVVLALGYLLLSLPGVSRDYFTLPLATIVVGNGLFKANPSNFLSRVYEETGANFDSGYTLYYMAVNIGSVLSMNITPILTKYFGWHVGFAVSFVGLLAAILSFIVMRRWAGDYGSEPDKRPLPWARLLGVLVVAAGVITAIYYLLNYNQLTSWILLVGVILLFCIYFVLMGRANTQERKGMLLFIILCLQAVIFFIAYIQAPTSLTLFALRNVGHSILGFIPMEPGQYQMLNPIWIIITSPILAACYRRWDLQGKDLSMPSKFALGTLLAGLGFLVLPLGVVIQGTAVISGNWLLITYGLQSVAELFVSALGLSIAARYIPKRYMGFVMGLWFLCTVVASLIGGRIAGLASVSKSISKDPVLSLPIYNHLFLWLGAAMSLASLLMFAFVPLLKKIKALDKQHL